MIKTKQNHEKKDNENFLINLLCTKINEIIMFSISDNYYEIKRKILEYLAALVLVGYIDSYETELDFTHSGTYLYCFVRSNQTKKQLNIKCTLSRR